ncbi:MAG: hypothetical protein JKY61_00425, partial [Planctomycetes bacterium]|nr:hypothetical protein [Planctomycetota bacterium]
AVSATGGGGDTYYGPAECCVPTVAGDNSSGLDNQDFHWVGDRSALGANPGCYWFGGYENTSGCNADGGFIEDVNLSNNPSSGFYVKIAADHSTDCLPVVCRPIFGGTFCDPANINSTGVPAVLVASFGSGVGSDLHLDVSGGPLPLADGSRMLGYFLVGNSNDSPGFLIGDGQFCLAGLGGTFGRYNAAGTTRFSLGLFDSAGSLENLVGTGGMTGFGFDVPAEVELAGLAPTVITSGDTYYFQCWFRDSLAGSGHSNFTNGVAVTFP